MRCRTHDLLVGVHDDSVVNNGDVGRRQKLSITESRRGEDDVVGLPRAGLAARVDERRVLSVDGGGVAIGVGVVVLRIEHLHLEYIHQEHAAVAAALTVALHVDR